MVDKIKIDMRDIFIRDESNKPQKREVNHIIIGSRMVKPIYDTDKMRGKK
jgi:hypothetical protein